MATHFLVNYKGHATIWIPAAKFSVIVLLRQLTTLSLEVFDIYNAMASLRVYCLLLLMQLLHVLNVL